MTTLSRVERIVARLEALKRKPHESIGYDPIAVDRCIAILREELKPVKLERCAIAAFEAQEVTEHPDVLPGKIWFDTAKAVLQAANVEWEE